MLPTGVIDDDDDYYIETAGWIELDFVNRLPKAYSALRCCKRIQVAALKVSVLLCGILSQTLNVADFSAFVASFHGTPTVVSVFNLV